ncbi:MAG: hypothetical protein J5898_01415 [Lachnospiraceae bacterium]|nr:hypothetical protein [Lachnospiraceae bacterium]
MKLSKILGITVLGMTLVLSSCNPNPENIGGSVFSGSASAGTVASEESLSENSSSEELKKFLGHTANNVYENAFIGIGCKLNTEWVFFDDEQIRHENETVAEVIGEEYKKAVENETILIAMYAVKDNGLKNIYISLEKLSGSKSDYTESQYIEASKGFLETPFTNVGYSNMSSTVSTASFAGSEHPCLTVTADYQGHKVYQLLIPVKCSGYMATITAACYDEDLTADILGSFYSL